jgi:hypothetical protein
MPTAFVQPQRMSRRATSELSGFGVGGGPERVTSLSSVAQSEMLFPRAFSAHRALVSCNPLCRSDSSHYSSAYSQGDLRKCIGFHIGGSAGCSSPCTVPAAVTEPEWLRKRFRHRTLKKTRPKRASRSAYASRCSFFASWLNDARLRCDLPSVPSHKFAIIDSQ